MNADAPPADWRSPSIPAWMLRYVLNQAIHIRLGLPLNKKEALALGWRAQWEDQPGRQFDPRTSVPTARMLHIFDNQNALVGSINVDQHGTEDDAWDTVLAPKDYAGRAGLAFELFDAEKRRGMELVFHFPVDGSVSVSCGSVSESAGTVAAALCRLWLSLEDK